MPICNIQLKSESIQASIAYNQVLHEYKNAKY